MSFIIPIDSNDPHFDLQTPPLDGVTYTLVFRWNVRASAWFMDIYEQDGVTLIKAGLKLVANWPLAAYSTNRNPPGALVAADTSSQGVDPGLNDLGDRVQLVYFTAADLGL